MRSYHGHRDFLLSYQSPVCFKKQPKIICLPLISVFYHIQRASTRDFGTYSHACMRPVRAHIKALTSLCVCAGFARTHRLARAFNARPHKVWKKRLFRQSILNPTHLRSQYRIAIIQTETWIFAPAFTTSLLCACKHLMTC